MHELTLRRLGETLGSEILDVDGRGLVYLADRNLGYDILEIAG